MIQFEIKENTTVNELKKQFVKEIGGGILRVYNGRSEASDDTILVSIGAKQGSLECRTSKTVGKFIQEVYKTFNIKIKIATNDNWVLVLNEITLSKVKDIPNNTTTEKMKKMISYKRINDNIIEQDNKEELQHIQVAISTIGQLLELRVVKDHEKLEKLYKEDKQKVIDLFNEEFENDNSSEIFKEDRYWWHATRYDDETTYDTLISVKKDNQDWHEIFEATLYECEDISKVIDEGYAQDCIYGDEEPDYDDENFEYDTTFLDPLTTDDEDIQEYFNYYRSCVEEFGWCNLNLFDFVRKQLIGNFQRQENTFYAGVKSLREIEYVYDIYIPKNEEFDIQKFHLLSDNGFAPDYESSSEWLTGLDIALYENQIIRGIMTESIPDPREDVKIFLVKDCGWKLDKIFSIKL